MARRRSSKGPEALTQDLILDWLAAERILAFRMNIGRFIVPATETVKRRAISFGVEGMADILAFPRRCKFCRSRDIEPSFCAFCARLPKILWIEVKSPTGSQRPEQRTFEQQVTAEKQTYILARRLEDVQQVLDEAA